MFWNNLFYDLAPPYVYSYNVRFLLKLPEGLALKQTQLLVVFGWGFGGWGWNVEIYDKVMHVLLKVAAETANTAMQPLLTPEEAKIKAHELR